jgi:serine/threonine protein kinase
MAPRSEVLGRKYQFEYEVGMWSFGTVEVVRDRESSVLKTCKTVQKHLLQKPSDAILRLNRIKGITHDHICAVEDVLEDSDRIFIISEKTQGNDVAEWLQRTFEEGNWIQESACAAYLREVLIACAHSHAHRICHRELRPGALLLSSKLPDASVKVVDFGLADILDPCHDMTRQNATPFTAPELSEREPGIVGSGAAAAADVWSIGAIAHMMLLGQPPAQTSSGWNLLNRNNDDAVWVDRTRESRDFVQRLTAREPMQRISAAQALRHPWLRSVASPKRSLPTGAPAVDDTSRKLLCFMLSTLLIPELMDCKHLYQIRSAFIDMDDDSDGLVTSQRVQEFLKGRSLSQSAVTASVAIADVHGTGVFDLCSVAVAEFLARQCRDVALNASDLAPRLLSRFFGLFGDAQRLVVSILQLRNRLCTATGREVELRAGVSFDGILSAFEGTDIVDSKTLVAALEGNAGQGTPLANDAFRMEDPDEGLDWGVTLGLPSFDFFFSNMFQTCGRCGNSPGTKFDERFGDRPVVSAFQF